MNERQLQSFVMAADAGSFSKAAARSFMTTSALSQQIGGLEKDMGFTLFDRSTTGVTLTAAGLVFYDTAKKILASIQASRDLGSSMEKGVSPARLRIATEACEIARYMVPLCGRYRSRYPQVELSYVSMELERFPDALSDGKVDLYFAAESLPRSEGARFFPMYRDTYTCCMPPDHRLSQREHVEAQDLVGEHVYMLESEFSHGMPLEPLAAAAGAGCIDTRPYSIDLPATVAVEGGVIMRFSECAHSCVPPLVCVPYDGTGQWLGLCCTDPISTELDWFIDCARGFFRTSFVPGQWREWRDPAAG